MCGDTKLDPKLRLFRSIFENGRDPMVVFDGKGTAVLQNRAARALPVEVTERLFARDGPGGAAVAPFLRQLSAQGHAQAEVAAEGRPFALEGRAYGAVFAVTVRDLSEERARDAELRSLRRVESAGHFAVSFAHDVNNYLMPILCLSETLMAELPSGRAQGMFRDIHAAAARASSLASQTLRLVRRQATPSAPTPVNAVIAEMSHLVDRLAGREVEVRLELAGDAGSAFLDRERFEQMVLNLVSNARDAMPDGGHLSISTARVPLESDEGVRAQSQLDGHGARAHERSHGGFVCVRVSDTGVGMTREVRERIFERFFTTKDAGRGTGLGLEAVQRFVEACRGCIAVHSEPGRGTTIALYFPLVEPPEESERTSA